MTSELPYRVGNGFDVHAIAGGLPMWLGGVRIESEFGFIAHSDGDVAIHALCDAILGALALGDIGHLFPDNDDRWKGVDSKELLKTVTDLAKERGWAVGNADITIALQRPKLAPYIDEMRANIAAGSWAFPKTGSPSRPRRPRNSASSGEGKDAKCGLRR